MENFGENLNYLVECILDLSNDESNYFIIPVHPNPDVQR